MRPNDALLEQVESLLGTLAAWRSVGVEGLVGEPVAPGGAPPESSPPDAGASPPPPAPRPRDPRPAAVPAGGGVGPAPPPARAEGAPGTARIRGEPRPAAPPVQASAAAPAEAAPPPAALFASPSPEPAPAVLFGGRWAERFARPPPDPLPALDAEQSTCRACARANTRRRVLLDAGPARPRLVIVVGPPAAEEEAEGRYFVGEAGQMLERMLVRVLALERADVRVVSVAPCAGGALLREEGEACARWLERRLGLLQPALLLVMGQEAGSALGHARSAAGSWVTVADRRALLTHHPAEVLADPALRRPTFDHLQELARFL